MKKQNLEILPYFDEEEQTKIGLNDKSLVIMFASSDGDSKVYYLNLTEKIKEDYDISEFSHMVESFEENEMYDFFPGKVSEAEKEKLEKPNYVSITLSSSRMEEDFDEDSRKTWMAPVGEVLVVDFYNGGLTKDLIEQKMKELEKGVEDVIEGVKDSASDNYEFQKDPYKYYGVSRRDFY